MCSATPPIVKGRVRGRVVSRAVVVATGVTATGDREVLGVDVGDSEDGAFWTAFLKGLRARGLGGVQLVISDHHLGSKEAIGAVFVGSAWQRCRVHFMRNVLSKVPKASGEMVAAAIRTIFAQPDATHVRSQLDEVARMLAGQFPDVATMLTDAAEDVLAFTGFPDRALAQDLVDEPARARQRRDQTTHQRRRDLPQRRVRRPARHRRVCRDPRRMGRRGTPLPLRRIHGQALHRTRPRTRQRRGDAPRDQRVTH